MGNRSRSRRQRQHPYKKPPGEVYRKTARLLTVLERVKEFQPYQMHYPTVQIIEREAEAIEKKWFYETNPQLRQLYMKIFVIIEEELMKIEDTAWRTSS